MYLCHHRLTPHHRRRSQGGLEHRIRRLSLSAVLSPGIVIRCQDRVAILHAYMEIAKLLNKELARRQVLQVALRRIGIPARPRTGPTKIRPQRRTVKLRGQGLLGDKIHLHIFEEEAYGPPVIPKEELLLLHIESQHLQSRADLDRTEGIRLKGTAYLPEAECQPKLLSLISTLPLRKNRTKARGPGPDLLDQSVIGHPQARDQL